MRATAVHAAARTLATAAWSVHIGALFLATRAWSLEWTNAVAFMTSVALGYALSTSVQKRAGRVALAAFASAVIVVDVATFRYFHKGVDAQLLLSARYNWSDVRPVVRAILPLLATAFVVISALEYTWLSFARARTARCAGLAARVSALAVVALGLTVVPARRSTPELVLTDAIVGLRAGFRLEKEAQAVDVNVLVSGAAHPPSVLFVLLESVRYESYCKSGASPCDVAPKTQALLKDGVFFSQARSIASYTAVSFGALITGQPQAGSKADLQAMPTLFEYMHIARTEHAAGAREARNGRFSVGYFSSQSESVFERPSAQKSIDSECTLETLVGHAVDDEDDVIDLGVDRLLATRVTRDLPKLGAPYLAFVHVSGTHAPYFIDETHPLRTPYVRYASWSKLDQLRNAYDNAINTQDETVAAIVSTFIDAQRGAPWLVIVTSDHGEAFGEHGGIHHGQSLYDEQVHVPLVIAWGGGALTEARSQALRANADAWTTHLDLLPTVLDAFGLQGGNRLPGTSLLAPLPRDRAPVPMTNCTAMFPCPVNTWGMLGAGRALEAQPWDQGFHCLDLATEHELTNDPACGDLVIRSRAIFPKLPNGSPNL